MTGDKRIQNGPWQGRIAVLLLILAIAAAVVVLFVVLLSLGPPQLPGQG